jgi:peroxiredoxin
MKSTLALFLTLVLAALATPCPALVKTGTPLPRLSLPDTAGRNHQLARLVKGKVAVIVYWSVSCPHCRREMPKFLELNRQMAGNPMVMIMVNSDGPAMAPAVAKYAEIYQLPRPVLLDQGPKDRMPFAEAFDVVVTPTVLVLDKKGKLLQAQEQPIDMTKLIQAIEQAFNR